MARPASPDVPPWTPGRSSALPRLPALGLGLLLAILAGCTGSDDQATPQAAAPTPTERSSAAASPSPSPSVSTTPSPSPSPAPPQAGPVRGDVTVEFVDAYQGRDMLGLDDSDPPAKRKRLRTIATGIGTALDAHLTAVQRDGSALPKLGASWVEDDERQLASLTTALGSSDSPITAARYDMTAQWERGPTLVVVEALLDRADGSSSAIDLVFDVSRDGTRLQLLGAGDPPTPRSGSDGGGDQ